MKRASNLKVKEFQEIVIKVANQIEKARNEAFLDLKIRPESYAFLDGLQKLCTETHGVHPSDLARELRVGTPSIARMTTRLQKLGLIKTHANNVRSIEIFLTEEGKNLLSTLKRTFDRSLYAIQNNINSNQLDQLIDSFYIISKEIN